MISKIINCSLLFVSLSSVTFGQSSTMMKIGSGLEINAGVSANSSGLRFTNLTLNSPTGLNNPAKVLTLNSLGDVVMANVSPQPVALWSSLGSTTIQTAATAVVIGSDITIPSNGTYGLYVSKGILTEKMRVAVSGTSSWADYVFSKQYQLRNLVEVEKFILKNKHLPDVPSAEEVANQGIEIAEMQATLLRKIEELTLYSIQQSKEIKKLKVAMKRNTSKK